MINNVSDCLFVDVSEWQVPVDDSYLDAGYRVISIRACDGTYLDKKWAHNYDWCWRACDSGRLDFFLVYCVYRPNWLDTLNALKHQINAPHPRMAVMLDVESWGGQIRGNHSDGINRLWWGISDWLGTPSTPSPRVIGYANKFDFETLWPDRPPGLRMVGAGYGSNPNIPGQIAHQYTNGQGYGARSGLPDGAPPFGNCDVNSADGLSVGQFAVALGIDLPSAPPPLEPVSTGLPESDLVYSAADAIAAQFVGAVG